MTNLIHFRSNIFQQQQNPKKTKERSGDVRQDKRRIQPPRSGSCQPAAVRHPLRAEALNTKNTSSQPVTVHKRNKQKLTLWVDPIDIEKLRLKAKKIDASMSSIGAEAIHKALHHEADIDYTITLKPLIGRQKSLGSACKRKHF